MNLTGEDEKILAGRRGDAARKAMELIVRYGEVVGADSLCSVTWADLFCGWHNYLDVAGSSDFDEVFSKMALCTQYLPLHEVSCRNQSIDKQERFDR